MSDVEIRDNKIRYSNPDDPALEDAVNFILDQVLVVRASLSDLAMATDHVFEGTLAPSGSRMARESNAALMAQDFAAYRREPGETTH